ncbi:hypothetical protein Efla_001203 [Eimeria flavescens]
MDDTSTRDMLPPKDEGLFFPLSQPELSSRQKPASPSISVQRRRRSAACCSAPYIAGFPEQKLASRQHTPPRPGTPVAGPSVDEFLQRDSPVGEDTKRVARELAEAAVASAQALAADAKAVDLVYASKPTAFLYKGHTAQIATSTAGMYGEMIESFVKQVVAYAKQYGADQFSVFCDLGSGRGAPCAIAAYEHDWLACLGIEKCPQAFGLSLETQRLLLLRETAERLRCRGSPPADLGEGGAGGPSPPCSITGGGASQEELKELFSSRPRRAIAFAHDDLSAFADLDGVTHAYSFDAAMEGPLINYITHLFMDTQTWWFYLSFRNDLISRFDLKGAEIKAQISSNMWVSSEGRTAYVYVKTDWKERQQRHRQWLRNNVLRPQLQQQALQQQLLRHVRIQQQLVLQQLQHEEEQPSCAAAAGAAASLAAEASSPLQTPRSSRRSSLSPLGTLRGRSNSRKRYSAAAESQQQKQQMVLFHLAARRQQLQVLDQLEPAQAIWGAASRQLLPQEHEQQQQQQESRQEGSSEINDEGLLEQLRSFRCTHVRLSKWHQPLNLRSLLLVSLLPFEGQNQWLQLQQQLLQPGSRVLTRAQRVLLLGYDEGQRKDEELQRDSWMEQLAAANSEEEKQMKVDIWARLTQQRTECMSLFSFLPPEDRASAASNEPSALPDGFFLRLGFRHSLQELQERQSPTRTPRRSTTQASITSRDSSPVWTPLLSAETESPAAAAAAAAAATKEQRVGRRRSPVRRAASRRRSSSHSVSSVLSRRRCGVTAAAAALAAADAAAAASPIQPKSRGLVPAATPPSRRGLHRAQRELRCLAFDETDSACRPYPAPMPQDAP